VLNLTHINPGHWFSDRFLKGPSIVTKKVHELAAAANVSRDTVRHYTRLGLIEAEKDPLNGYHRYTQKALQRIRFIKLAQGLGFKLQDAEFILSYANKGDTPCPQVRELIARRLADCAGQLHSLTQLFNRMQHALEDWQSMPGGTPTGHSICRLIESEALEKEISDHE
jgi:DNA-binding transcriptional MerR regulator